VRLLVEIAIIGVVISLGWSKPFKERFAQVNRIVTATVNGVESKLQKHKDASVKHH
jgi:hypothetical protein